MLVLLVLLVLVLVLLVLVLLLLLSTLSPDHHRLEIGLMLRPLPITHLTTTTTTTVARPFQKRCVRK